MPKGFIYHEKQTESMGLCGLHALNNLFQFPLFRIEDLDSINETLSKKENNFIHNEETPNDKSSSCDQPKIDEYVSDDGILDIEVLKILLKEKTGLHIEDCKANYIYNGDGTNETFLLRENNHWFGCRSIDGKLFNLDSLQEKPTKLNKNKLSFLVNTICSYENSSVHIIKGFEDWMKVWNGKWWNQKILKNYEEETTILVKSDKTGKRKRD